MMRANLSRHSYQIRLRNILVCELATHSLTIVFFHVNIMFIVHNVSGTIGLIFPGRRHYFFLYSYSYSYAGASTTAVCCHFGAMLTPGFCPFQHPIELRTVSTPVRLVSLQHCAELRFVLLSEVL